MLWGQLPRKAVCGSGSSAQRRQQWITSRHWSEWKERPRADVDVSRDCSLTLILALSLRTLVPPLLSSSLNFLSWETRKPGFWLVSKSLQDLKFFHILKSLAVEQLHIYKHFQQTSLPHLAYLSVPLEVKLDTLSSLIPLVLQRGIERWANMIHWQKWKIRGRTKHSNSLPAQSSPEGVTGCFKCVSSLAETHTREVKFVLIMFY